MNDKMLDILRNKNEKIKKQLKPRDGDKFEKPKHLEVLTEVLRDSPYLDVLYGDRENYEMAPEHLIQEDVVKVVRCKKCKWFLRKDYPEKYDGNCELSGCKVCNECYFNHGELTLQ